MGKSRGSRKGIEKPKVVGKHIYLELKEKFPEAELRGKGRNLYVKVVPGVLALLNQRNIEYKTLTANKSGDRIARIFSVNLPYWEAMK